MMKTNLTRTNVAAILAIAMLTVVLCTGSAQAIEIDWPEPNWPEIFEPNQLLTFYLQMDPCDWQAILHSHPGEGGPKPDCIYDPCELPAWFWMEGEEHLKIVVEVRRKKGFAFPDETDPCKVALKIDINQYYPEDFNAATEWHGLKKLSLEINIDSMDIISEGVAINIHRMASLTEGYDHAVWYGNWVKLYVNGNYIGVYVNAEQRDKQFMKHRNSYTHGETWLYKHADCEPGFVLRVGDDEFPISPAVQALCYEPFIHEDTESIFYPPGGICWRPNYVNMVADMNEWVNMKRMLSSAAIDAFLANSGVLFRSSENTYFLDFDDGSGRKRMYFPWDVDSSFKSTARDIYYTGAPWMYDELIIQNPVFRSQYNQIMRDLLAGPLTFADINDFLDMVEPVITVAVEADPWAMDHIFDRWGASSAAECFDALRSWFAERIPDVLAQIDFDEPNMPPGIILLHDSFETGNNPWDTNWNDITHSWEQDSSEYLHGSASAHADKTHCGDFICDPLDTNDATAIHIDFWLMKKNIASYNPKLYYYGKTGYNDVCDLDTLGGDEEWLHYTDTVTDSQYFTVDFRINFSASLGGGGAPRNIWIDDVVITKERLDYDGIPDANDNCPYTYNPDQNDVDLDGVGNVCDNCPNTYNPTQTDIDADGLGNVCDNCWKFTNDQNDTDSDGYGNPCDNCPDVNNDQSNSDADIYGDLCDNCPDVSNPDQNDIDLDDAGNVCDNCPNTYNPDQNDVDLDGIGDDCECDRANLDGINPVDFNDFAILGNDWQKTGPDLAGDTNWNLVVDFNDLAQIVQHWLSDCPP